MSNKTSSSDCSTVRTTSEPSRCHTATTRPAQPESINIHSRLSAQGKAARCALLEYLITTGHPFDTANDSLGEHDNSLPELEQHNVFARDAKGHIAFAYPVSALPTAHRVTLADGRHFYAMCAVDAMGSHFALQQDVSIMSRCAQSGEPIQVSLQNGEISTMSPTTAHAIHIDLSQHTDWASSC